jgi:predicted permease
MRWWTRLLYLLPWKRRIEDRELDEELQSIVDLAADDLGSQSAARRALGNLTLAKEDARAVSKWAWLESVLADIQYTFRVLRREPSFAAIAVITLGLCIGANAAVFSLVDAVLVRMLPVREPEQLMLLKSSTSSYFAWQQFSARSSEWMTGVLATTVEIRNIDVGGGPFRGSVELITGNYFDLLGVPAARGRMITPEDDQRRNPAPVAVLSQRFWRRYFAADTSVLGRIVRVQGQPLTVVGIAPAEFFGIVVGQSPDLWIPLSLQPAVFANRNWLNSPNSNFLDFVGRLRPGINPQVAADALTPVMIDINVTRLGPNPRTGWVAGIKKQRLQLAPAVRGISSLRDRFSQPLKLVFGMVGVGLLLGCLNLMSLQLARARERRRELGIRMAIGASRARVLRQLLTESLVISIAGAALGLLISSPAASALLAMITIHGEPVLVEAGINRSVLWFVCAIAVTAALISGLLPALRALRGPLLPALQSGARSITVGRERKRLGRSLAGAQLGLSLFLAAAACLFSFSLHKLLRYDIALDRSNLVVLDTDTTEAGYDSERGRIMAGSIVERLRSVPGVKAVTFSENGLFAGRNSSYDVYVDGFQPVQDSDSYAWFDRVGPRYFTTIGATLVAGRDVTEADFIGNQRATVVSESFARYFFRGRDPIGKTVYAGKKKDAWEVVGVVRDMRVDTVRETPRRWIYLAGYQPGDRMWSLEFLVRTAGTQAALSNSLRQAIQQVDPRLPVRSVSTGDELLNRTLDRDRLLAFLASSFGALALAIAAVGIYGLLSYEVAKRTNEVGIRMALGATRSKILAMVLREVLLICAVGVAIGTAAALACSKLVEGMVFGIEPRSPLVLSAAAAVLLLVALAAALIPARRAASINPMLALRHE